MSAAKMVTRLCLLLCCLLLTERLAVGSRVHHRDKHGHGGHSHESDSHEDDSHGSDSHGSDSHGGDSHEHKHCHYGKAFRNAAGAHESVLSGYNPHVVPQKAKGVPVNVAVGVTVVQLNEIDKEAGEIEAVIWLMQSWNDPRLKWKMEHYNIEQLAFTADQIWIPDLAMYNSVKTPEKPIGDKKPLVQHTGDVTILHLVRVRTTCSVTDGDSVSCTFVIGSWVHDDRTIDVHASNPYKKIVARHYTNTHWTVESATSTRLAKEYPCCPGRIFPSIAVTFTFKRE